MPKCLARKRKPGTKAEQQAETLEQIFDAAEYLFSKHGLNGMTPHDVALWVGVHASLMHYYFVDKRQLFEAVFARGAGITKVVASMPSIAVSANAAARRPSRAPCLHSWIPTLIYTSMARVVGISQLLRHR
jgi:AcrR family transcriptional regulator